MDKRLGDLSALLKRPIEDWRSAGYWGQAPLWQRVRARALSEPDRLAVADDTGKLDVSALWTEAVKLARAMRRSGVERGDLVLVQLPNWREFAALVVAIEACGAVLGFCPAAWGVRETARALKLIQPKVWFLCAGRNGDDRAEFAHSCLSEITSKPEVVGVRFSADQIADLEAWSAPSDGDESFDPDETGLRGTDPLEVAVTSGTTGDPKGVLHVCDSATAAVQSTIERQAIHDGDSILVPIPVGHTFGYFYGVRCALQSGALLVLQERWNAARMVELVEKWRISVSLGPSACLVDLLALPEADIKRLASMRLFTQSGDSLPVPVAKRAADLLNARISRALGMTEFGHVASTDAGSPEERVLDSAGSPQPGISIEIRGEDSNRLPAGEIGKVMVSGPFLFAGYLHPDRLDQDVLDEGGYFATGDLGWLGEDGYLHITGREKNVIRRGAMTIPTSAVEDALASHPGVAQVVLIARPDERLGEQPVACIQMRDGAAPLDLATMQSFLADIGMTKSFWPEEIHIVAKWPLGATAKVDRAALLRAVLQKGHTER